MTGAIGLANMRKKKLPELKESNSVIQDTAKRNHRNPEIDYLEHGPELVTPLLRAQHIDNL